ncbi:DUF4249 domain-containing protein [Marinilongibacter aquaticus]|uniref:DUF4249 domain-containing protein n=1 Tax=Marinilongibacter aquaticus TaxID=2975157 RepID=UPI0021BD3982|nr:DUF4249 domain-containing protein [Marinilongibacter aquaticus]UBM60743.1 DUF4249 domain-containing protein [Marinilongibacter aquaticus]
MKLLLAILLGLGLLASCISPFDFDAGNEKFLVIDGHLYDIDSSYISLRYTAQSHNSAISQSIVDANVSIIENATQEYRYTFNEAANVYVPQEKGFRSKIGSIYTLKIELSNGEIYRTKPDTVRSFPEVEGFFSNNDKDPTIFELSVRHTARTAQSHYYLYKLINYTRARFCAECLNTQWYDTNDSLDCNSPFQNCNSIPRITTLGGYYGFLCDQRSIAWNYKIIRDFTAYSDEILSLGEKQTIKILDVPVSTTARFFAEIHQANISKEAYEYFLILKQAGDRSGTLFDPTPPLITGNVYNEKNPQKRALGYFLVGSQHIYGHYVDRTGGKIVPIDPNIEFDENIRFGAPAYPNCDFPPLSEKIAITNYRTDIEPVGWNPNFQ